MNKTLHICSEYSNRPLYSNMVSSLDELGYEQHVYVPVRRSSDIGKYRTKTTSKASFSYSFILNPSLRIRYYKKVRKISRNINTKVKVQEFDLIHAHTLFTNGGPAYRLYRQHGTPYIVALRNTDLTIFYKYFPHIRHFGIKILRNAAAVVFISPSWKEKLRAVIPQGEWAEIEQKSLIIPNAVDDFWLENRPGVTIDAKSKEFRIIYAGRFIKKKGLQYLIKALDILNKDFLGYTLTLAGGGGNYHKKIQEMAAVRPFVRIKGQLPKELLIKEFRQADMFAMPSHAETFGLVYIEAMSQGLPVLYSQNEGIDGLFTSKIPGKAARHNNPQDIARVIKCIEVDIPCYSENALNKSEFFSWNNIARKYADLYKSLIEKKNNA